MTQKKRTENQQSTTTRAAEAAALELALTRADRFAELKRVVKPLVAELDVLEEQLKDFFRTHPDKRQLGDVLFSVSQRKGLDTKRVRAALGEMLPQFEKVNNVEQLIVQAPAKAAA